MQTEKVIDNNKTIALVSFATADLNHSYIVEKKKEKIKFKILKPAN